MAVSNSADEETDAEVGGFKWPGFQPPPDVSFDEWDDTFDARLKDGSCGMTERSAYAARTTFKAVKEWYGSRPEGEQRERRSYCLASAEQLIIRLDEALHWRDGPFTDETYGAYGLWRHHDFQTIARMKPKHIEALVDHDTLREVATEYLGMPWMHNPHLDWVLADALVTSQIAHLLKEFLSAKLGIGWVIFDGVRWKAALWRTFVTWPWYAANWLVPGWVCLRALTGGGWGWGLGGIAAGLYLIVNLWFLAMWLRERIRILLSGKPSPMRTVERVLDDLSKISALLGGDVVHVPTLRAVVTKAMESNAAAITQQFLYILDNVEARGGVWRG